MKKENQLKSFTDSEISSIKEEIEELKKILDLLKTRIDLLEDKRSFLENLQSFYTADEESYSEFVKFVSGKGRSIQNHICDILKDNMDKSFSVREVGMRLSWRGVPVPPEKRSYLYTILSRMNEKGFVVKTPDNKWKATDKITEAEEDGKPPKISKAEKTFTPKQLRKSKFRTEKTAKPKSAPSISESVMSLFKENPDKVFDFKAVSKHVIKAGTTTSALSIRHALKMLFLKKKLIERVSFGFYRLKK